MNEFGYRNEQESEKGGKIGFLVTVTSYVSLIPYVGLAVWLWTHAAGVASHVLAVYAALMFVYTGAVHWGWSLADRASARGRIYLWTMLALIVGWVLASLPWSVIALPLLAAATVVFWYAERRWFAGFSPRWYSLLRAQIAIIAAVVLVAAWIKVLINQF